MPPKKGVSRIADFSALSLRLRPSSLEDYVSQYQLSGVGKTLLKFQKAPELPPLLLIGPPGVGKTTIANFLGRKPGYHFEHVYLRKPSKGGINLDDLLREAIRRFRDSGQKTILFLDEIHHCPSDVQKKVALAVGKGFLSVILATIYPAEQTVVKPLLSLCQVIDFKPYSVDELKKILQLVLTNKEQGLGNFAIKIDEDAQEFLCHTVSGNAREMLKILERTILGHFLHSQPASGKEPTPPPVHIKLPHVKAIALGRQQKRQRGQTKAEGSSIHFSLFK